MPHADAEIRHDMGIDQIMWGSDYPHPEGTWPYTQDRMIETFKALPEDEVAAMLGGNAAKFYGFDKPAINEIAGRIGPLRSDFADC